MGLCSIKLEYNCLLIGVAAFPLCYIFGLRQSSPEVYGLCGRVNGDLQEDLSQGTPPELLLPVLPSPQQATADPHLHKRPSNTHRQVWLSLLWAHCSFPQVLACTRFYLSPFQNLNLCFPQPCESPVIKSHWSSKSDSLGFPVPLPDP